LPKMSKLLQMLEGKRPPDGSCVAHLVRCADGLEQIIRNATAENQEQTELALAAHNEAMARMEPANYRRWCEVRPVSVPTAAELERFIRTDATPQVPAVEDVGDLDMPQRWDEPRTQAETFEAGADPQRPPAPTYPPAKRGPAAKPPEKDRFEGFRPDSTWSEAAAEHGLEPDS